MHPSDQNQYASNASVAGAQADVDQGLRTFMLGVYKNMIIGLATSALVAIGVHQLAVASAAQDAVAHIGNIPLTSFGWLLYMTPLMAVVAFAPLAFIFFFSVRMERISVVWARATFFAFAAVMGASLSTVLIRYTGASVVQGFFLTAASFGGLSLWGYTTRRALSGMGSFLMMGVIGLIATSLVNVFFHSGAMQFAISVVGVAIFAGLTAYDTQSLKEMYFDGGYREEAAAKASIFGALKLYLDFVNLLQFLLALFGNRNQ